MSPTLYAGLYFSPLFLADTKRIEASEIKFELACTAQGFVTVQRDFRQSTNPIARNPDLSCIYQGWGWLRS